MVVRSNAEVEMRYVAHGICKLLWLKLLAKLKVIVKLPMKLYYDNKTTIIFLRNSMHHEQTKHAKVDKHFIKEKIEEGIIRMTYVPSSKHARNLLTKGLIEPSFEKLVDKLRLFNLFSLA